MHTSTWLRAAFAAIAFWAATACQQVRGDIVTATTTGRGAWGMGFASGSGWRFRAIGLWLVDANVSFGHPAFGPPSRSVSPNGSKNVVTPVTRIAPAVKDPDNSGAFGEAAGTVVYTPGVVANYNYNVTAFASGEAGPPRHDVRTVSTLFDPVGLDIGNAGTSLDYQKSLLAGTQVQGGFGGNLDFAPGLVIEGRFGLGDYAEDPLGFWAASPPDGVGTLFRISIFENASQLIDATVQLLDPPSADFAYTFGATSSDIVAAIRNANWSRSGKTWTLNQDLSLVSLAITTLNASNAGAIGTIGTKFSVGATAAVPEPSSRILLAIALGGMGVFARIGRRGPAPSAAIQPDDSGPGTCDPVGPVSPFPAARVDP